MRDRVARELAATPPAAGDGGSGGGDSSGGVPSSTGGGGSSSGGSTGDGSSGASTGSGGSGGSTASTSAGGGSSSGGSSGSSGGGPATAPGSTTGAAPAPAAAPATTVTPAAPPTAADHANPAAAQTNVWDDINGIVNDNGVKGLRTVLEAGRVIPVWGLLTGGLSDAATALSDLSSFPTGAEAPITRGFVIAREAANVLNNAVGHLAYLDTEVQNAVAASVVFSPFTAVTATAAEAIGAAKVTMDGIETFADFGSEVGAIINRNHAGTQADADKWQQLAGTMFADVLGDLVNDVIDGISLATADVTQGAALEEGGMAIKGLTFGLKDAMPYIVQWVTGIWNIWGSNLTPQTAPPVQRLAGQQLAVQQIAVQQIAGGSEAQATLMEAVAAVIDSEVEQGRTTWTVTDAAIGALEDDAAQRMAQANVLLTELSGGRTPFEYLHQMLDDGMAKLHGEIDTTQQMLAMLGNAETMRAGLVTTTTGAIAAVDAVVVPNIELPKADGGDSVLGQVAAGIENAAGSVANAGLDVMLSGVRTAADVAKSAAKAPLQTVLDNATSLAEVITVTMQVGAEKVAFAEQKVAEMQASIARSTDAYSLLNNVIGTVENFVGLPPISLDDIRAQWAAVPGYLDHAAELATALRSQAATLRSQGDATSGAASTMAAPPDDPQQ